ncbi:MAG: nicotinate phosphoribosyltransferase, partial [Acidimicrobiia bacterium]|nr:nicotinate phosphoribosyltransferase [Acidimicrobiia bacterium]
DTYTTPTLLDAAGDDVAAWPAVRIDSGDPIEIGRQVLRWWEHHGEGPRDHALVFSDALDLRAMSLLHDIFEATTDVSFGWGTNLTNDVGVAALALVIKPDAVDGIPCVKLSDDLAKATGDRQEIARYLHLREP